MPNVRRQEEVAPILLLLRVQAAWPRLRAVSQLPARLSWKCMYLPLRATGAAH